MVLKIGSYREVYEAHRNHFITVGHSETDASAIAQLIVSRPLPESALHAKASYLESTLPLVSKLLEWDTFDVTMNRVSMAVYGNWSMFEAQGAPSFANPEIAGVYPGLVVLNANQKQYAADWTESAEGDISLSNVRDVSAFYRASMSRVVEEFLPCIEIAQHAATIPLEIEKQFLVSKYAGEKISIPAVQLDGLRPALEQEFMKYLRAGGAIKESFESAMELPACEVTGEFTTDDMIRMSQVSAKLASVERQCIEMRVALSRPSMGQSMLEKATTIQTVIIDKGKFSESDASSMARRNGWDGEREDSSTAYRFRQHQTSECESGTFRTIALKDGVSAVVCQLKRGSQNEQWIQVTEAGDFVHMAGHDVHIDREDAASGDLSGAENQIKAHNRFSDKLEKNGFANSSWNPNTYSKDHENGYSTTVKLGGGKAHVAVTRHGDVRDMVGSASSGPELEGHLDAAASRAKKMPEIEGYSEQAKVQAR
jgi:hypothetical protein